MDFLLFLYRKALRVSADAQRRKMEPDISDINKRTRQLTLRDDSSDLPRTAADAHYYLKTSIKNVIVQPQPDGLHGSFFPEGSLEGLITPAIVRKVLPGVSESVIDYVCKRAPFAFSYFARQSFDGRDLPTIARLLQLVGYDDAKLPLVEKDPRIRPPMAGSSSPASRDFENIETALSDFCTKSQWEYIPVGFKDDNFIDFGDQRRMPFIFCKEKGQETFYSVMMECQIPKKHLETSMVGSSVPGRFENAPTIQGAITDQQGHFHVAVKKLKSSDEDAEGKAIIEEEVKALELAKNLETGHIIKYITHYKWRGKHFLMFPWAGRGDLRELWKQNKTPPTLSREVVLWMMEQFVGMAGAIEELHNRSSDDRKSYCRHGDIKPQNILCFGNPDDPLIHLRLVIADVGLARIHEKVTKDRSRTKPSASTIMYEAPEMGVGSLTEPKSRDIDVWSMGCVFFEFIVWLLYGYTELDLFSGDHGDTYYKTERDATGNTTVLHPGVLHWINHILNNDWRCSEGKPLRLMVELIATRLLVVAIREHPAPSPDIKTGLVDGSNEIPVLLRAPTLPPIVLDNSRIVRMTSKEMQEQLRTIRDIARRPDLYENLPKNIPLAPRSYNRTTLGVPTGGSKQVNISQALIQLANN